MNEKEKKETSERAAPERRGRGIADRGEGRPAGVGDMRAGEDEGRRRQRRPEWPITTGRDGRHAFYRLLDTDYLLIWQFSHDSRPPSDAVTSIFFAFFSLDFLLMPAVC